MQVAYQPVVEVVGDTPALMTRRERGVWSSRDTNQEVLAIARGRIKVPRHLDHSMYQVLERFAGPRFPARRIRLEAPAGFLETRDRLHPLRYPHPGAIDSPVVAVSPLAARLGRTSSSTERLGVLR